MVNIEGDDASRAIQHVSSVSLRTEIVDALRDAILGGLVKPGDRLNERILAERFGVSRPPLREAIRQLESEGLVVSRARRGAYVRSYSHRDVREIYELRYALEAAAAELVAELTDPSVLALLEMRLRAVEDAVPEGVVHTIEADLQFHRELVKASSSSRLIRAWDHLVRELRLALIFVDEKYFEMSFVVETHRPLLEAIRMNDRAGIRRHTETLRQVGDALAERWEEIHATTPVASTMDVRTEKEFLL